jgi:hypothetical protein
MGFLNKLNENFRSLGKKATGFVKSIGKVVHRGASALTPMPTSTMLSPQSKLMAQFAEDAYKSVRQSNIGGYDYDAVLSSPTVAVYANKQLQRVVIAYRGTAGAGDLAPDLSIARGTTGSDPRFAAAAAAYEEVKDKYPGYFISATGHSLGGALAISVNEKFGIPAEVFNPGVGLSGISLTFNPNKSKLIINVIKGDPVSSLSGLFNIGSVHTFASKSSDPLEAHKMGNFLAL